MIIRRENHDRAPASIGRSELDAALLSGAPMAICIDRQQIYR